MCRIANVLLTGQTAKKVGGGSVDPRSDCSLTLGPYHTWLNRACLVHSDSDLEQALMQRLLAGVYSAWSWVALNQGEAILPVQL